ncbi:MAG: hypothetical protein WC709_08565 [Thermoleophilia bacterium]
MTNRVLPLIKRFLETTSRAMGTPSGYVERERRPGPGAMWDHTGSDKLLGH